MAVLTLLTDFGTRDGYVAAMKGVILSIAPAVTLVDITHEVAPRDVAEGAFTLATCWRFFPPGTVHVAVVDPGVGSARRGIAVAAGGHTFVGPDNGLLSMAVAAAADHRAVCLEERRFFHPPVSATFHGRDVFAPVAAHLTAGAALADLGPEVSDMAVLPQAEPRMAAAGTWEASVAAVDRFGNLITNVPERLVRGRPVRVTIGGEEIAGLSDHYAQAAPGALLALVGSSGYLEVAENLGSAAERLGAGRGTELHVAVGRL